MSWHLPWGIRFRAALPVFFIASFLCAAALFPARAYTFIADPPYLWPNGNVSMVLKLGYTGRTLMDGNTSWDAVASQALSTWNSYLGTIQFAATTQSPGIGANGDSVNQAFFNSTVYGRFFGSGVLAVTTGWRSGTARTEGDVTFNNAVSWDSYRGPLKFPNGQLVCDLRRVALHEFGHVLGLDHPDQAGQTVSALMNSVISDMDALQYDDITGAQALYPLQPPSITTQPQSQTAIVGDTAAFAVVASGAQPLSYQWRLNGADISGATSSTHTRNNVQPADAGNYTAVVSNGAGSITSQAAILTVNSPPAVSLAVSTNGGTLFAPATITLIASANDTDGNVKAVDFYLGTNFLGTATTSPFSFNWNSVPAGTYSLTAIATDNLGATTTSMPVSLTINPPTVCIPAPDGLVTWWPGDGNADDIIGKNGGVVFGATSFVAGKVGRAFNLNGIDGYVIRTNAVATTAVDNWSMAAWVFWKGAVGTAAKEKQTLLYNGNENNNGYGIIIPEQGLCSVDGRLCSEIGKLVVLYGGVSYVPTGITLDLNAWNHVALVRENSALKLYKNGTLVFSNATATPNPPSATDGYMTVGTTPGYAFYGLVDEVLFFNAATTGDQVRSLCAADNLGICKPLKFDAITPLTNSAVLLNLSGQAGKNLTIYSSPDLLSWLPIVTAPNPQGTLQFTNAAASAVKSRFYKAAAE